MKIIEWNINQRSNWNARGFIPVCVSEEINELKPDAVIITEFSKTLNWLDDFAYKLFEYNVFTSTNPKGNEVLIAIKKEINIITIKELPIQQLSANFLQIDVEYQGVLLTIIGIRIRIDDTNTQLNQLSTYLGNVDAENVIVLGDFNVWHTWASNNNNWSLPQNYIIKGPKVKMNYNDWSSLTKWSYVFKDDTKGPIDFVITKGVTIDKVDYLWDFLSNKEYKGCRDADKYKGDDSGNPDHAILIAELTCE
jgi:exonuclease III